MKIPRRQIAQVISDKTITSKYSSKKLSKDVAAYLLNEKRVKELDSILRDIQSDWANDGYIDTIVFSAHPLTDNLVNQIKTELFGIYPNAKTIKISNIIDRSLIGGIKIEIASTQQDLSVKAKLKRFEVKSKESLNA